MGSKILHAIIHKIFLVEFVKICEEIRKNLRKACDNYQIQY
ncbi:hypothetical protein DHBDCA_p2471 [Dehalobacter sp. DCA]|nr:hypothetical protein DHBDCA_p2471 [Dehalobacter sp. DCA]